MKKDRSAVSTFPLRGKAVPPECPDFFRYYLGMSGFTCAPKSFAFRRSLLPVLSEGPFQLCERRQLINTVSVYSHSTLKKRNDCKRGVNFKTVCDFQLDQLYYIPCPFRAAFFISKTKAAPASNASAYGYV